MPLRKKIVLLLVSFALANVALHAIINFHFYRIFGQDLVQIENEYIKKDESYLNISPDCDNVFSYDLHISGAILDNEMIVCPQKYGFIIFSDFDSNHILDIGLYNCSPTRGSPRA